MIIYRDRVYTKPLETLIAFNHEEVRDVFCRLEELRKRYVLIGYVRYEAKDVWLDRPIESSMPLVYLEVFDSSEPYCPGPAQECDLDPRPTISFDQYRQDIDEVKRHLHCGDTYQVNYTYECLVNSPLQGLDLYESILPFQQTPYNAYIINEYEEILSFSPELFFEWKGQTLRTKPMKGTIKRGDHPEADECNKQWLAQDEKNRSENVMIVDLLRNDLGRIAVPNSVQVTELFAIETHPTVHQMTSEILAAVPRETTMDDVFRALFPCGSITGAPKISTMDIIDRVEKGSRDVYCGAIAYFSPQESILSVPIRILQRELTQDAYRYRVGGGIVWDSDCASEWFETQVKTRVLKNHARLVETLLVKDGLLYDADAHWQRMKRSACELGYQWDESIEQLSPSQDGMMRVLLSKSGKYEVEYYPLHESPTYRVRLSSTPVFSTERFLKHKTTYRPWYQSSMEQIKSGVIYDDIFVNELGHVTEGARSNVFVKLEGKLYTPPLSSGLLPGVLRHRLLESGACQERILHVQDLISAEQIYCGNSVRGLVPVELENKKI